MAGSRETVPAREATVPSPAPASSRRAEPVQPGQRGRISEIIVEQIRLLMRQGQLKPGDRLPPERDLCERFGVSRVTVREALRTLESSGLVEIRVGARGGAFVTVPSSNRVGEGLADLLTLSVISAADVTEIRMILAAASSRSSASGPPMRTWPTWSASASVGGGAQDQRLLHGPVAGVSHPGGAGDAQSGRGHADRVVPRPLLMSLQQAREDVPEIGNLGAPSARAVHRGRAPPRSGRRPRSSARHPGAAGASPRPAGGPRSPRPAAPRGSPTAREVGGSPPGRVPGPGGQHADVDVHAGRRPPGRTAGAPTNFPLAGVHGRRLVMSRRSTYPELLHAQVVLVAEEVGSFVVGHVLRPASEHAAATG